MALTESEMLPLGTPAPDFCLPMPGDRRFSLADFSEHKGLVVAFICNHCPYVIHIRERLVELAREYQNKDIGFVAISSNDVTTHPDDAPEKMAALARELAMPFPYLFDESQAVAKAYGAACTPDFFLFDSDRHLFYRGRFDDSTPGNNRPVTGSDLRNAMDALLEGRLIAESEQAPSMGCNIKWKPQ